MYNKGLHGKVRHSEELSGIYGFKPVSTVCKRCLLNVGYVNLDERLQ